MFFVVKKRHAPLAFISCVVQILALRDARLHHRSALSSRDFFDFICRPTPTPGAGPRPCQRILTRTDTFIRPVRLIEWLRIATDAQNPRPRGNHHAFATVCISWGDPVSRPLRAAALLEPWHRADCGAG